MRVTVNYGCNHLFQTANLVAEEFFQQGDLEQKELKATPMAMMDRKKKDELPQMQLGFVDSICLPIYKVCGGHSWFFLV